MDLNTPIPKEKIAETMILILKKQERFKDITITEKSQFDRDLRLGKKEFSEFIREVEITFHLDITSNVTVFMREIGQLAYYIESQIIKKL